MPKAIKEIITPRGEYRIYPNDIGRFTIMKVRGDNLTRVSSADTEELAVAEMVKWASL